jgi:pyruvate dehydrogenase E2 component (dihydrolipoamide acetyltransferase)
MAREFRLPDIGEGLTEAEIVRWLVAEGDMVDADQPLVEVETDKAVVEIPSPYAGMVLSHGGAEGEVIEVGTVLVTIGDPGELPDRVEPKSPDDAGETEPATVPQAAPWSAGEKEPWSLSEPIVGSLSEEAELLKPRAEAPPAAVAAIKALPIVRKLARDHDIDLEAIDGSGPDGRITRADVEAAISQPVAAGSGGTAEWTEPSRPVEVEAEPSKWMIEEAPLESDTPAAAPGRADDRRPMTRLRRTIAANMAKSWAEIPHVTTFDDVDATRLLEVRRALGDRHGLKIPLEALVIKAVLPAIDEFPVFNSTIDGDDLVVHSARDVGIAVDTAEGLMVAVVREADQRSVLELAREVRRLGEGARDRTLAPGELTGQTFTVSNIGAVGGGHGTPIIPYGTVAILSVGNARSRPIVYDGDLAIAPVMPLSLSYDHRVIDGAVGRRFMALVIENLEEPALFLAG